MLDGITGLVEDIRSLEIPVHALCGAKGSPDQRPRRQGSCKWQKERSVRISEKPNNGRKSQGVAGRSCRLGPTGNTVQGHALRTANNSRCKLLRADLDGLRSGWSIRYGDLTASALG